MSTEMSNTIPDWFGNLLELARHIVFILFYILSARIVFVTLSHTTTAVSIVVSGVVLLIVIFALWKIQWVLYGFVIGIPIVSGFQVIGFMKGLPLLSVGFAAIYLAWLPKRLIWEKKGIVPENGAGNLVDTLSAVVLISLIMLLAPYPVDFVFNRLWNFPFVGQNDQLYGIEGGYVILQGLFFYRVTESEFSHNGMWRRVIPIIYIQAGIIILFSLFQWIFDVPPKEKGFIVYAPFDDKHSFGSYVVLLFFVLWSIFYASSLKLRVASSVIMPCLAMLIVLCWSRATWLAAVVVAAAFFMTRYHMKKSLGLVGLLCIFVFCLNIFPGVIQTSKNRYLKRLSKLILVEELKKDANVSSRFALWKRALGIMGEYPFVGSGVGTYYKVSLNWKDPKKTNLAKFVENTHNYYLQFGADLGIPALLIFLAVILYALIAGLLSVKQSGESRHLVRGLLFGLSAYLITMVTGHPLLLSNQQFLFWFVIVVICITYRLGASQLDSPSAVRETEFNGTRRAEGRAQAHGRLL